MFLGTSLPLQVHILLAIMVDTNAGFGEVIGAVKILNVIIDVSGNT